jgi:hypothetical protein
MGLADDVADQIRVRAMAADLVLERFARSVVRRRRREGGDPPEISPPQ